MKLKILDHISSYKISSGTKLTVAKKKTNVIEDSQF